MDALAWDRLGEHLRETQLLGSIQSALYWDQNTRMPPSGASWRGEQLSLLAKYLHSRQTSKQFEELLFEAKTELETLRISSVIDKRQLLERSRNIQLLEQDFCRQKSLDSDLVAELALAKSFGYNQWQLAKKNSDFKSFVPALTKLINLRKEQVLQLSEPRTCWETLAQPFEPDITIFRLKQLFDPLRKALPNLLEKARSFDSTLKSSWDLDEFIQEKLCNQLLMEWGRKVDITALDYSPHPFSITLGPQDFRLTSRVVPGQPLSCFLATAHEWGHSLYEQGLPSQSHQWFAWPLGQATSMGLHESQSLFWENRIARSWEFSDRFWVKFQQVGAPINSGFDLWRAMNPFKASLNRVEADELSYGLHILIRTDLEIDLLEKGLPVEDIPHEWNKRYKDLMGLTPSNDREGCLQDVHWSEGQFGYFPSYLLGHLISAQLSEALSESLTKSGLKNKDPIGECISLGRESILLEWLRKEVHSYGRKTNAETLVKEVTGKTLSSAPFLNHLENKLHVLSGSS